MDVVILDLAPLVTRDGTNSEAFSSIFDYYNFPEPARRTGYEQYLKEELVELVRE